MASSPRSSWKLFLPKIVLSSAPGQGHWRCCDCGSVSVHRRGGRRCQLLHRQERAECRVGSRQRGEVQSWMVGWQICRPAPTIKPLFSYWLWREPFSSESKQKHVDVLFVSVREKQFVSSFLRAWVCSPRWLKWEKIRCWVRGELVTSLFLTAKNVRLLWFVNGRVVCHWCHCDFFFFFFECVLPGVSVGVSHRCDFPECGLSGFSSLQRQALTHKAATPPQQGKLVS